MRPGHRPPPGRAARRHRTRRQRRGRTGRDVRGRLALLPRAQPDEPEVPRQRRQESRPTLTPRPGPALDGARVLIVDDQQDARELVALILEDAGAEVLQAASVAAAFDQLGRERVDAVVSDIAMPTEDGYALAARLRAMPGDVPALALTAFARAEDRERAIASGFQGHVSKPIDPARLVAAVVAWLGRG